MKQPNIFPQPRPWTPEHVAATLSSRAKERGKRADLETYPTIEDVAAYLRSTGREDLLRPDPNRDRYAREKALISDLDYAKAQDDSDADVDGLRRLVWKISERIHPEQSRSKAAEAAHRLAADIREELVDSRAYAPDEVRELEEAHEERAERIRTIAEALELGHVGEDLADLLPDIEYEYSNALNAAMRAHNRKIRKRAEQKLALFRAIRDALYHGYLFPRWTEVRQLPKLRGQRKRRVA